MDIKELNKQQLILLTLLITFVVSIATGIITVSLMQQMPESVPQTVNNVIQRTIERVTTVQAPALPSDNKALDKNSSPLIGDGDAIVSIYLIEQTTTSLPQTQPSNPANEVELPKALGQGIIISETGLILVDSSILTDKEVYKVILGKIDFNATIIKKFTNGFTILKITQKKETTSSTTSTSSQGASVATPEIDKAE